jgi:hypothetical protein
MTDTNSKDMPEVIVKAMERHHSELCLDIINYRDCHKTKALSHLPVYIKLFEDTFELLAKAIQGLDFVEKQNWKKHNTLQVVFFESIPKTLFSAFQQIMSGDYFEGLATCRIVYETLLRICFIEVFPENQYSTIISEKGKVSFQPTNFLKDTLKVIDKDPFYEFLSLPVHSHKFTVLKTLVQGQKQGGLLIDLGFEYEEKDLQLAFNNLIVITYFAVRLFQDLFNTFFSGLKYLLEGEEPLATLIKDAPNSYSTIPILIERILDKLHKK